jgi:hypothetical protein
VTAKLFGVDQAEHLLSELGDLDLVVLVAFVERPDIEPRAIAGALKASRSRPRRWRVRRAIRRLVKRDLLRADVSSSERNVRYTPRPDAGSLVVVGIATRKSRASSQSTLPLTARGPGRRRSNW